MIQRCSGFQIMLSVGGFCCEAWKQIVVCNLLFTGTFTAAQSSTCCRPSLSLSVALRDGHAVCCFVSRSYRSVLFVIRCTIVIAIHRSVRHTRILLSHFCGHISAFGHVSLASLHWRLRTTVFRGPQSFEPSYGIRQFLWNFNVSVQVCRFSIRIKVYKALRQNCQSFWFDWPLQQSAKLDRNTNVFHWWSIDSGCWTFDTQSQTRFRTLNNPKSCLLNKCSAMELGIFAWKTVVPHDTYFTVDATVVRNSRLLLIYIFWHPKTCTLWPRFCGTSRRAYADIYIHDMHSVLYARLCQATCFRCCCICIVVVNVNECIICSKLCKLLLDSFLPCG